MRRSLCALVVCLSVRLAGAALITQQTDVDPQGAVVDGAIGANEYGSGNSYAFTGGGAGFGGQLGGATLLMNSDGLRLQLGFSNLGVPADGNQYIVYLDTRPGGYQPDGAMNDFSDGGRANVSRLARDGTERVTFDSGVSTGKPDFALLFNNRTGVNTGFSAWFELKGAGTNHALVSHTVAGLGSTSPEFSASLQQLGLTPTSVINVAMFDISADGYLANEGLPGPVAGGNPGYNTGATNSFADFHRFVPLVAGPFTGLTQRAANVTLRLPSDPPPATTNSYTTEDAFPEVAFTNPLFVTTAPGEPDRLYVVERPGRIVVITNLAAPTRTVFMDIESRVNQNNEGGLLSLAFHPNYTNNHQFFVYYTATGNGFSNRVARYTRQAGNPNAADTNSQVILIGQFDEQSNHNGGTVMFGPDGYLYVGLGDEGGFNDNQNNSQIIDKDFFSCMMRLDVDKKPGSLPPHYHPSIVAPTNYAIPPDNPFISTTTYYGSNVVASRVRTEFFAAGLRNPFRFTFDPLTGRLIVADVGQDAWEEIDVVTNGGNYGWAAWEGFVAGPKPNARPASDYARPLLSYPHNMTTNGGFCITGGVVYRGDRMPELVGTYIFSDYVSGNIWGMTDNGVTNTAFRWLASDAEIAGFGIDPRNGDVLMCDLVANQVKRLVPATVSTSSLPATLADTGAFFDLNTLTPYVGIVPYHLNQPFWSDGALKSRWFSVPSTNLTITFDPQEAWTSPTGTVWIKHFDLQLTNGNPASARRIETRFLVKNASGSGGYGVTYRWGASTNNAVLVPAEGLDENILINDSGIIRTQLWHYPSRQECLACHRFAAGLALGFNTAQLNRDTTYAPGDTTNQLARLAQVGYFNSGIPSVNLLPAHPALTNTAVSVEYRARSYLQVNCAQCHFPGGPVPAAFDARLSRPLAEAGIVRGALADDFGNTNNKVVRPGVLTNSMIYLRASTRGSIQMPPLATSVVDTQGMAVVAAWINGSLTNYQTFAEWQVQHFGSTTAAVAQAGADPDGDGTFNDAEYLLGKNPTNGTSAWNVGGLDTTGGQPGIVFERVADRSFDVQANTNLLDGAGWHSLDTPANRAFYGTSNGTAVVQDPSTNEASYYRVRVQGP